MAKVSPNPIESLDQDWGNDPNVNLPFGGQAVQNFIKSYLRNVTAAAYFDPTNYTMYFFASVEDRDKFRNDPTSVTPTFSCPMNFSSTLYRVNITNNTGSTSINTATNAGSCVLSTSFIVQMKSITDLTWTDTQTGCYVTVLIDRGLTGEYTPITERTLYSPGATIALDVFPLLVEGVNRIKFQFEAEDDSVTQALIYTVTLAELFVELFNSKWYRPIVENDVATQEFGGFKIAGAGSKTLHIGIYNEAGELVIEDIPIVIGTTNAYVTTPYFYRIPPTSEFFDLPTGIYKLRVYVSTSALNSEAIEYNVMLVRTADVSTAKLVCINEVAESIFNYSNGVLCKYSLYNGNANYADIVVTFRQKDGDTVVSERSDPMEDIITEIEQSLGYQALWPGIEGTGYSIEFEIELDAVSESGSVPIDNSTVFPPTPDYDFYLVAANRFNSAQNRDKIVNVVDNSELTPVWDGIDFQNGVDGWTEDDEGRACLRIPAKTKMVLPYTEFNMLSGENCTIELCYKVANCSDYSENVITLCPNPDIAGFKGVRIQPTNITVHKGTDIDASKDGLQGTNICDDEVVHFVLTINPFYSGSNKLVTGYVNGCKNFMFEYGNAAEWGGFNANLAIGSEKSDVFVYLIRHYPTALSFPAVETNYINSLGTVEERDEVNYKFGSVVTQGGNEIDYETVKNNDYNFFVIQMTQGNGVPSAANGWGKKTEGKSILEMHFGKHPEWDWKIDGPETMGQGTTSMNYYRWNIRWRIDKANADDPDHKKMVPVSYCTRSKVGGSYKYTWGEPEWAKTVRFDGTNHPPLMRITAKINQASSMQSHKIGATRAYTELHDRIGLQNEAQGNTPKPVVAVYEYPAFGFEYDAVHDTYSYIGLFTIGPDKGDKPSFGYDKVKKTLITLEGTDHSQPLAKFAYPWVESNPIGAKGDVAYYFDQEGLAINLGEGSYLTGLEMSNCHDKEIDGKNKDNLAFLDQPAIRDIIAEEFKPAYLLAWENSTLIFPIKSDHPYYDTDVAHTLANINAHLTGETYAVNFRKGQYNSRLSYADMQFWIEGDPNYTLYYYDEAFGIYKPDISLYDQLGTPTGADPDAKNEWFKARRREQFMAGAGDYWDLDETIYHFVFCLIFGATDNFAKNSYPYKMAKVENGGRWRWRQDDLDTIFDIDNSGRDSKPYQIEYNDTIGTTPYFAGSTSTFWTLINECYWDDYDNGNGRGIRSIGQAVIGAMVSLSGANNPYDGFIKYITQCFWGNAQNYFPESAYNVDAEFKYELAWLNNGQSVDPLTQALGNHYSGERLWVRRRAVYMLSLFRYGPFGDYSDNNLGTISFRPTALEVTLTPLMWMYPAMAIGQNSVVHGQRTQPGVGETLSGTGDAGGNTTFYIQGSNYYTSLGNLRNVQLGLQDLGNITIRARKLVELLIGGEGEVLTNIPGVVLAETYCLETIDFRNASSIRSLTGLVVCARLRTLLLTGTSISVVELQTGSKVETLALPAQLQNLTMRSLRHIQSFSVESYANMTTIFIEDTVIDTLAVLQNAYDQSSALKWIRVVWAGIADSYASGFAGMIDDLASGDYFGVAEDGATVLPKPVIDGTFHAHALYSDDLESFHFVSEETYQTNLKKGLSRLFDTNLYIIYNPSGVWIRFADTAVEAICLANWDTSGDGHLTISEAAVVTTIRGKFNGNTTITSFDEFKYFTNLSHGTSDSTALNQAFYGCTNLKSIEFPPVNYSGSSAYIYRSMCNGCSNLERIYWPGRYNHGSQYAFVGTSKLTRVDILSIEQWCRCGWGIYNSTYCCGPFDASHNGHLYLDGVELTHIDVPSVITSILDGCFRYVSGLKSITLPSGLKSIGDYAFYGSGLLGIELPEGITSIGSAAFAYSCNGSGRNLTIPASVANVSALAIVRCCRYGKLTVKGNMTVTTAAEAPNNQAQHLIVHGNLTNNYGTSVTTGTYTISIRIGGNYSAPNGGYISYAGSGNTSKFAFFEIMGTASGGRLCYNIAATSIVSGAIVHLGYEGVACTPAFLFRGSSGTALTVSRFSKIYVGDGSSRAHDEAVLAQYQQNQDWIDAGSTVLAKLGIWWDYVNSDNANQDYVNNPFAN